MKNVHCLYRVSTHGQVDVVKDDIPMQKIACHEFAERQGWVITKEYAEKGISGSKVHAEKRDAIQDLKAAALNGEFNVLLVFMFDRIGRIDYETPFVVEWFAQHGIEVWSVMEGEQRFETHVDKLMNYIRFWQASGESAKMSLRIKTRMKQLVAEGCFTTGVVPYGYKLVKKGRLNKKGIEVCDLVVNEDEAQYVRDVYTLYVRDGYGSHRLAEYLNKKGLRTHNGSKFQATTMLRMLSNKTYCGYFVSGGVSSGKIEEISIIDEALWEKAQIVLEQRRKENERKRTMCRKTDGQTLLSGNIFCAECGGRMVSTSYCSSYTNKNGETKTYSAVKYMCYHRARKLNDCKSQATYDAKKIDGIIYSIIKDMFSRISDEPQTTAIERKLQVQLSTARKDQKRYTIQLEKLNWQLEKLQNEIANSLTGDSIYSAEDLAATIKSTREKIKETENSLEKVNETVSNGKKDAEKVIPMYQNFVSWADEFERASLERKRMILSNLIERVEVGRGYKVNVILKLDYEQFCRDWNMERTAV